MLSSEKGQSLIEVLVVLVLAAMMIIALITIILLSLKNAQFAQNQTTATKLAQDTIDNIRILRDSNKYDTLALSGTFPVPKICFKELWNNNASDNNFYCGSIIGSTDCYYQLNANGSILNLNRITNITPSTQKEALTDNPGFTRQIKVTQNSSNEVTVAVDVNWTDSSGEHKSSLETYLIKPNYDCI